MTKNLSWLLCCICLLCGNVYAQNIDLKTQLGVENSEVTIPIAKVTESERFQLKGIEIGDVVYQTDGISGLYTYTEKGWIAVPANNEFLRSLMVCNTKTITVNTVADLANIHSTCGTDINTAIVLGYHQKHDGGGGVFVYDTTLSSINDGGLVFDGWKRSLVDSSINVKWFGAVGDASNPNAISLNNDAFKKSLEAFKRRTRANDALVSNRLSKSGIFIPSGEYRLGENAIFFDDDNPIYNFRLAGITYYSDGNAILSLANSGDTYAFNNLDRGLFITFRNITFIGENPSTNGFYTQSTGGAQDYYFDRCSFYGNFNRIFTVRGADTNSEWSFNKCSFTGQVNTILDVKDSDQFLNYWFNETKFWSRTARTLVAHNGGHFKFVNCDWSGFSPEVETYLFELNNSNAAQGVNDFRIINGRFEMKTEHARVLKSNWRKGNIEINADFGSQSYKYVLPSNDPNYLDLPTLKHFQFNMNGVYNPNGSSGSALNVNFKNSVMMGYHEFNYNEETWRGPGKVLYENCAFPYRNSLDGFIEMNHGAKVNKAGIASIEVRDAIFNVNNGVTGSDLNLEVNSVNYLPLFANNGVKRKIFKMAHPARGTNPLAGQSFTLNFPEESESVIRSVKWYLPKNRLSSIRVVQYALTDINGNIITDDYDLTKELKTPLGMLKDGFDLHQEVFINVKNLPEGKLVLKDISNFGNGLADQAAQEFLCVIEYY